MLGTMKLQEWIHRLELGAGARYLRWLLTLFAFAALAVAYDSLCFRNLENPEAMDAAQLGRNIGQGKGYTTLFVRPFSMALTREHRADKSPLLKASHRDISNAPVYPMVLAAVSWLTPAPGDLTVRKGFRIVPQDLFIAVLNQALMGLGALLVFCLALGWFDRSVAWASAVLFALTELYWRFSISGLSTMLLMDLVLLLVWMLSRFERDNRENGGGRVFVYAVAIGVLVGLAMLTRYSAGWLIMPTLVFVAWTAARKRLGVTAAVFCAFAITVTPWLVRNTAASGWPFGTATFAVLEETPSFPSDTLERSLNPSFAGLPGHGWDLAADAARKGVINMREIVTNDLPRLGGNWLWAFFLVGLMVRFQNTNLSRVRWFVVGAIALMAPVQALSRTHLSTESPGINAENLLVLFSPLVLVFGVGLFFVLVESLPLSTRAARFGTLAGFGALISLPLLLALMPPRGRASAPYYAPRIQQVARYINEREMLMSDIPWAVAWYGQRQCVPLTLNWQSSPRHEDFTEINDFQKTVNGLYVSTRTTDDKFLSGWFAGANQSWGSFLLFAFVRHEIPDGFPLKRSPEGWFANGELLLMDRDRWTGRAKGISKKD
jgi:hypothetical protein